MNKALLLATALLMMVCASLLINRNAEERNNTRNYFLEMQGDKKTIEAYEEKDCLLWRMASENNWPKDTCLKYE